VDISTSLTHMAMNMSQARTQQSLQLAMLQKVMNTQELTGHTIVEMMGAPPSFGHSFDVRV